MSKTARIIGATLILIFVAAHITLAAPALRAVALSGQQAAGTPTGVNYAGFSELRLNNAGHTAFAAQLSGNGVTTANAEGVWSERSGSLELLVRAGSQAPGTPSGVTFNTFPRLRLNDTGQVAFVGSLLQSPITGVDSRNNHGIWSERSGTLQMVAREGHHAPGTPAGVVYDDTQSVQGGLAQSLALNSDGQTAFFSHLRYDLQSHSDFGIWSEGSGTLDLVARGGSQAAGLPSGVNYNSMMFIPNINDAGQLAFAATLSDRSSAMWVGWPSNLMLVARSGDNAPGTSIGTNFASFTLVTLNAAGQTTFHADLAGDDVDTTNDRSIWFGESGNLTLIAREGDQAPGTPAGVNYGGWLFTRAARLNNTGQVAFSNSLSGNGVDTTNDSGIWLGVPEDIHLFLREGTQAPGTPNDVHFRDFNPLFFQMFLNNRGQLAIWATLTGSGINSTNDRGIWASDLTGALHLIAREGDLLEVAPFDFRTISSFVTVGFNDRGQLAFTATFTGGSSGVFVSNLVAVPESSTFSLLTCAIAAGCPRRRRLS